MTTRYDRIPQSTGDLEISNNVATVIGFLGVPFNSTTPVPGSLPFFDQNGIQITQVTVLPISFIPTLPYTTPSQVAARIHARM